MTKIAAVNFANDAGWYRFGQTRLIKTLRQHGFEGDYLAFQHHSQLPGCPSHQEVPYAFKVYALRAAMQQGYEIVFWGDASIYAVNPILPVFERIAKVGYYLEMLELNVGTWSSDRSLANLGISREIAFTIPVTISGCIGFDFRRKEIREFLNRWFAYANDGSTFLGSWTNAHGEVSADSRVRGHRHDQTALSALAYLMRLDLLPFETYIFYTTPPPSQAIFHCHPIPSP